MITVRQIQETVSEVFGVPLIDLIGQRRNRAVTAPRHIAMWICRYTTTLSLPAIGHRFDGRDHTTVMHAVKRAEALMEQDADLRQATEQILGQIGAPPISEIRLCPVDVSNLVDLHTHGCVYLCKAENVPLAKIGWTENLPKRLKALQTGSPYRMWMAASIKGPMALEAQLHTEFASRRRSGEWFDDADGEISARFAELYAVGADLVEMADNYGKDGDNNVEMFPVHRIARATK